jgi:hypothetical protein
MRLADDPAVEEFRAEFSAFLDANLPSTAGATRPCSSSSRTSKSSPGGGSTHSFNPQGLGIIAASLLTFVRTDPGAPKHKGISVLLIPTDTEGVVRRPFGSIAAQDDLDFNEVFFTDVAVPRENLVGPLHEGWSVANGSLGHERTLLWLGYAERLDDLLQDVNSRQEWYATLMMDPKALKLLGYRQLAGQRPDVEVSLLKLFGSEAVQNTTLRALEEQEADGLAHPTATAPFNHMNNENFSAS